MVASDCTRGWRVGTGSCCWCCSVASPMLGAFGDPEGGNAGCACGSGVSRLLFCDSAGSMSGATMTMELVLVAFASPLASSAEFLCSGGGGAAGKLPVPRNGDGDGDIPAARRRHACACCSSRVNPWKRFRRIHLPKLTAPPHIQLHQHFNKRKTQWKREEKPTSQIFRAKTGG